MKKNSLLIVSAVLALVIAGVFGFGITSRSRDFNRTVEKALSASVDYDKSFIGMVDRLEQELSSHASFGYQGGKDPMTGLVRKVVVHAPEKPAAAGIARAADTARVDPVRLTAIIYDDEGKKYTAIVMNNERSFSVGVGDKVNDRTIREITKDAITMDDDSLSYRYDVSGKMASRRR